MARSRPLRAATRGSPLARWQAEHVASLLGQPVELVVVETSGDRRSEEPIWRLGGRGVFVKEVQAAVLDGRADFAVHSAKDLPSTPAPGLRLATVPRREDPRDAMVGSTLDGLAPGARVGTGAVRRRAQLAARRPDLTFGELRGNIGTRLDKASGFDAIVVALAALRRLGRDDVVAEVLDPSVMVPQVGQGALAVECREDDAQVAEALAAIEHGPSRLAVDAERSFLAELGGGCDLPVAGYATVVDGDDLHLTGLLASADGRVVLRESSRGGDTVELGRSLARRLLDGGGTQLLDALRPARDGAVGSGASGPAET